MQPLAFAAFLLALIPTSFGVGISSASPELASPMSMADPCSCKVVNKSAVTTASGTCAAGGTTIPCFTASQATFPQGGQPSNGICADLPTCGGSNICTYKTMRIAITVASCAADCGVADPVPYDHDYPGTDNDDEGTQTTNSTVFHDIEATGISDACGSPEQEVKIIFFKKTLLTAFKVTLTFGCGQCTSVLN